MNIPHRPGQGGIRCTGATAPIHPSRHCRRSSAPGCATRRRSSSGTATAAPSPTARSGTWPGGWPARSGPTVSASATASRCRSTRARGDRPLPRLRAGGRHLPAAQHGLHPQRGRLLRRRCRAAGDRRRARAARRPCRPRRAPRRRRDAVARHAGDGTLMEAAAGAAGDFDDAKRRLGRPRRHPLHVRHHRPLQGRDAHPRQPRLERAGADRDVALHRPTTC